MNTHIMTLFPILNPQYLNAKYRLVEIKGLIGNLDEDYNLEKNLNLLVKKVAFDTKNPVALVRRDSRYYLAMQHDITPPILKYTLTPDVATLVPLPDCYELDLSNITAETLYIVFSFLGFALRTPLMRNKALWRATPSSFYSKTPANSKDVRDETDAFQGFTFRLIYLNEIIYLGVRVGYKYVDRRWLTDRCQDGQLSGYSMKHALYHFGHQWYPVQLLGVTGKSIEEQEFNPDDGSPTTTVLNYTRQKAGPNPPIWIQIIDPESPAINYKYPGNEKRRYGALALCKLIHATDDPTTQHLHRISIKRPDERLSVTVRTVAEYFQDAGLNGIPIRISTEPLEVQPRVFPVSDLVFGHQHILKVRKPDNSDGVPLKHLGRSRMESLLNPNIGALVASGFDAQYLIAPLSLMRQIVEDFKEKFEETIQQLIHAPYRMEIVIYDDRTAKTLKQQVDAIMTAIKKANINWGHAVLILPTSAKESLHNYVKRKLVKDYSCLCQCMKADSLSGFYEMVDWEEEPKWIIKKNLQGKYVSYLRYTALGHLIVNHKWLWALSTPMNYDVHIGLDVLAHTAAFTFLYEGGHRCYIRYAESKQKEKLLSQQIREVIYRYLKEDLGGLKQMPRSAIIHRDGRSYPEEWKGFQTAIRDLKKEKVLPDDVKIGVIEIHKHSSLNVRLVSKEGTDFLNPPIGSWQPLGERDGIVCTTGYPFITQGTANPLHIRIAYGELNLASALEDEFRLSLLCWMVPDRCCRLPIIIQLSDDFLRPVAAKADDDEAEYGEKEISEEEFLDSVLNCNGRKEVYL